MGSRGGHRGGGRGGAPGSDPSKRHDLSVWNHIYVEERENYFRKKSSSLMNLFIIYPPLKLPSKQNIVFFSPKKSKVFFFCLLL